MAPLVTGVVEGNYNVLVKTDIQNNIIESDEENNIGMSLSPIYVKVKELPLNVDEPNTLENVNRYYKLRIPDSLYNATILVTLKTNDSSSVYNEMYIAGNRIPTAADHDYMFEIPNYGKKGTMGLLTPGNTIAIEPMATLGREKIVQEADGWTLSTKDGSLAAHFEHTVLITEDGAEILTRL